MTCKNVRDRGRGGHKLQVQVAERSEVPRRKRQLPATAKSPTVKHNTRAKSKKKTTGPRLMAQLKLDGDRLQAHVLDADTVRLFTRNGYDVSDIYSDVCDELRAARLQAPCIFDGELIVVNAAGLPLPWDDAKWRFNSFYARVDGSSSSGGAAAQEEASDEIIVMPVQSEAEANCHNANEEEEESALPEGLLALVPRKSRWTQHPNAQYRTVPIQCHLRYMVFDMLMWNGEDLSMNSCRLRHRRLKEALEAPLRQTRFVSLLQVFTSLMNSYDG